MAEILTLTDTKALSPTKNSDVRRQTMFGLIRLIISAVFFSVLILIIKKKKPKNEKYFEAGTAIAATLLFSVLSLFPFENAVYTFKSPEAAYRYSHFIKNDLTVSGKTTSLAVSNKGGRVKTEILQKTKSGWKLPRKTNAVISNVTVHKDIYVYTWRYKTSDDYFVVISSLDAENQKLAVKDTLNSEVFSLSTDSPTVKDGLITYYLTIHKPDLKYRLTVNGMDFFINE